jgi:hypothetical protein
MHQVREHRIRDAGGQGVDTGWDSPVYAHLYSICACCDSVIVVSGCNHLLGAPYIPPHYEAVQNVRHVGAYDYCKEVCGL